MAKALRIELPDGRSVVSASARRFLLIRVDVERAYVERRSDDLDVVLAVRRRISGISGRSRAFFVFDSKLGIEVER